MIYGTNVTEDGTITPDKSVILEEGKDYTLEVTTDNETGQQKLSLKWPILKHLIIWNISLVTSSAGRSVNYWKWFRSRSWG